MEHGEELNKMISNDDVVNPEIKRISEDNDDIGGMFMSAEEYDKKCLDEYIKSLPDYLKMKSESIKAEDSFEDKEMMEIRLSDQDAEYDKLGEDAELKDLFEEDEYWEYFFLFYYSLYFPKLLCYDK